MCLCYELSIHFKFNVYWGNLQNKLLLTINKHKPIKL